MLMEIFSSIDLHKDDEEATRSQGEHPLDRSAMVRASAFFCCDLPSGGGRKASNPVLS